MAAPADVEHNGAIDPIPLHTLDELLSGSQLGGGVGI
jgi:hypothetical protein